MKTITLKRPSPDVLRLLAAAKHEDVVVEAPDGEQFMLSTVDEFGYEVAQQRRNKKLMAFLKMRFRQAAKKKGIPLEQAFRRLGIKPRSAKNDKNSREE